MRFRPGYLSDPFKVDELHGHVSDVRSFNLFSYLLLLYSDGLNFIFCNHGYNHGETHAFTAAYQKYAHAVQAGISV
jgi:hypothetical protein